MGVGFPDGLQSASFCMRWVVGSWVMMGCFGEMCGLFMHFSCQRVDSDCVDV